MLFDLGSVLMFMVTAMVIVGFTLLLAKAVRADNPNPEKLSGYECGEDPIGSSWVQFNIRFYVIALIFLIFEVEIVFLYPWAIVFKEMGFITFIEMMIFVGSGCRRSRTSWVGEAGFSSWIRAAGRRFWTTPRGSSAGRQGRRRGSPASSPRSRARLPGSARG